MPEAAPIPFFTLPNLLSLARLPLGWLFWIALGPTPARAAAALGVMGAAAATDVRPCTSSGAFRSGCWR